MTFSNSSRLRPIRRAIISLTDKTGAVELCRELRKKAQRNPEKDANWERDANLNKDASGNKDSSSKEIRSCVELISTGGTFKELKSHGIEVTEVCDVTRFPEMLDGRVKTLHPHIHAGILAKRDNAAHQQAMGDMKIDFIDLVVVNLYNFEKYSSMADIPVDEVIEQIDIGGPSMLRSAAKNFADVVVLSSPSQYPLLLEELEKNGGQTSFEFRKDLAAEAFRLTSSYDKAITDYFTQRLSATQTEVQKKDAQMNGMKKMQMNNVQKSIATEQIAGIAASPAVDSSIHKSSMVDCPEFLKWSDLFIQRPLRPVLQLKYGLNPHQQPSCLCLPPSVLALPFTVLNGRPGYINFLDALSSWQLVKELTETVQGHPPAAASFKHVSPAGVALGHKLLSNSEANHFDLSDTIRTKFGLSAVSSNDSTPDPSNSPVGPSSLVAAAIIRARNCDPLCSFGDFVAVSGEVDELAASVLKTEVSDGIVASSFTPEALKILSQKKSGSYVILQADISFKPPTFEYRELYGVGLWQKRNEGDALGECKIVTMKQHSLDLQSTTTLRVAAVTMKYTQSNSVCLAFDGQAIGVAAGQQSRIDAVKLAGKKAKLWQLRRHPTVMSLPFKKSLKRQERVNGRVAFLEKSVFGEQEEGTEYYDENVWPTSLTREEISEWLSSILLTSPPLCASSDGFFPFRDSVDAMAKHGVVWVAHPGGSVADETVTAAAEGHGMGLVETGTRLFVH